MERVFPENWVHETGRLVVVGNAAHPWPVRRSLPLDIPDQLNHL
jgi:hypothetical protein